MGPEIQRAEAKGEAISYPAVTHPDLSRHDSWPDFRVKGSTIRSKLDFAAERLGPRAVHSLTLFLSELVPAQILEADWYPFASYDHLLHRMAAEYFEGDLERLQEIGDFSAHRALSTTYSAYAVRRDFFHFLERISALHERFYSLGRLRLVERSDDGCVLQLEEVPVVSLADVQVARGFYRGAAQLLGRSQVVCEFEKVEGPGVCYRLAWES